MKTRTNLPQFVCPISVQSASWQQQRSLLYGEYFLLHQSAAHLGSSPDSEHAFISRPVSVPDQLLYTSACSCHCQTKRRKNGIGRGNFPHGTCSSQQQRREKRKNGEDTQEESRSTSQTERHTNM